MLELKDVSVVFNEGTTLEKRALDHVSIHIHPGEFITILGSNGAGKSTFFNAVTGKAPVCEGQILLDGKDITAQKEYQRSRLIGRLYQDPSQGTAPGLTVEENLALAYSRSRGPFSIAVRKQEQEVFKEKLKELNRQENMTALMITHNMKNALEYGDRLLIFNDGKISQDFSAEEKANLTPADLLEYYEA